MSKTYKGYELIKAIADGEIKEGTKFKDLTDNNYVDNSNIYRYENKNFIGRWGGTNILMLLKHNFELIEDEIDIQSIEELKGIDVMKSVDEKATREENLRRIDKIEVDYFYKINDIVKQQNLILEAVKQLNRKSGGK